MAASLGYPPNESSFVSLVAATTTVLCILALFVSVCDMILNVHVCVCVCT